MKDFHVYITEHLDFSALRRAIPQVRGMVLYDEDGMVVARSEMAEEGSDLVATMAAGAWFLLQRAMAEISGARNAEMILSASNHALMILPYHAHFLCLHISPFNADAVELVREHVGWHD